MRAMGRFVGVLAVLAYLALSSAMPARADSALDLGSSNAYVTFGVAPTLGLAQFTVETWFRRDGTGVSASTGTGGITLVPLVSKGAAEAEGTNVDANYILGINTTGNVIAADFEEGAGGASPGLNHPVSGVTPIVDGLWYHAAATYDGSTWRLYLNGVLEAELFVGQPTRSDSIQHAALGTTIRSNGTTLQGFFDGALDEARIWNTPRTASQIRSTMNQAVTSGTGLVARWGLDEGAGTAVNDSVAPSENGTIMGTGSSWIANAPFDIAPCANNPNSMLRFDGTNDYVTFGTSSELGLAQFTIETWFKREGTGVSNTTGSGGITNLVPLIAKGAPESDGSNVDANYILGINTSGNVLAADFEDTATGLNHPISGTTAIVNNLWYHAAATYDGTTWNLYLNGNLEATLVVGAFTPRSDSVQPAGLATMQKSAASPGQLGFFAGVLDEARIWSVARSQVQIQADRYSELTSGTGLVARWGFGEGTGTTAADSVGAPASNGTLTNGPAWVTSSFPGTADGPCDDGLFCNGEDACNGAAGGLRCAIHDGDPCAGGSECADTCDEGADSCNDAPGTPCGSSSDTVCDNPDTCNGAGTCSPNYEPGTTVCRADAGDCDVAEFCNGAGACPANGFETAGTSCGDPSDNACTDPDTCNGSGTCLANNAANGSPCGDQGVTCHVDDTCQSGVCQDNGFATPGSACGDSSDTECTNPDTCSPIGTCLANNEANGSPCGDQGMDCLVDDTCQSGACQDNGFETAGTSCGDPSDSACTDPDTCNGSGTCLANDAANGTPCGDQGVDCWVDDTCQSGACQDNGFETAGTLCTDEPDVCTDDSCDGAGVCTHVYDETNDPSCPASGCDAAPRTGCSGERVRCCTANGLLRI